MKLAEQLRTLAEREQAFVDVDVQEWPEVVWRAYHVGRRQALTQAAELAELVRSTAAEERSGSDG